MFREVARTGCTLIPANAEIKKVNEHDRFRAPFACSKVTSRKGRFKRRKDDEKEFAGYGDFDD